MTKMEIHSKMNFEEEAIDDNGGGLKIMVKRMHHPNNNYNIFEAK